MCAKVKWRTSVLLLMLCVCWRHVHCSQEIMKNLTVAFGKALETCKKELGLPDHVLRDFYSFWKEEHPLVNSELGCALMCMANKFDMVTEDFTIHHDNAHKFASQNGADDALAKQLVEMLHVCEKVAAGYKDDCTRVLEIAKCFKAKIHELKWAPSMELVIQEMLTEV